MDWLASTNFFGVLGVVLLFGGSIFVHELGHFLAARAFGLKVLRFSIGFGPKIAQWSGRDGCKYVLSLLPLGGYVAIPQLVDLGQLEGSEESDAAVRERLPKAGFLAKVCVSAAGALFNLITAFVVALIVGYVGLPEREILSTTTVGAVSEITDADGAVYASPAGLAGIREGDVIKSVDGKGVSDFESIVELVAVGSGRDDKGNALVRIVVERGGKELAFDVRAKLVRTNPTTADEIRMVGIQPASRMVVGNVMKNSPAQKAGILEGDEIVGINGVRIFSPAHMSKFLEEFAGREVVVDVLRNGKNVSIKAVPQRVAQTKPLLAVRTGAGDVSLLEVASKSGQKTVRVFAKNGCEKIEIGDILYEMDGAKIGGFDDIVKAAAVARKVRVLDFADANCNLKSLSASELKLEPIGAKTRVMLGYALRDCVEIVHPSVGRQFADSISKVVNAVVGLANPQSDIGLNSLAGPVDIGRVIYKLSDSSIMLVLSFTVLLNINLAFLNLLPIPVLDGGHILFAVIEKLRGKPLPATVLAAVQTVFALFFMAVMAYVVYIGFMRWNGDKRLENRAELYNHYYVKTKF